MALTAFLTTSRSNNNFSKYLTKACCSETLNNFFHLFWQFYPLSSSNKMIIIQWLSCSKLEYIQASIPIGKERERERGNHFLNHCLFHISVSFFLENQTRKERCKAKRHGQRKRLKQIKLEKKINQSQWHLPNLFVSIPY